MTKIFITEPKYKKKSKTQLWLKRIIIILFFVLFFYTIYFLFFSPFFKIDQIIIFKEKKEISDPKILNRILKIINNSKFNKFYIFSQKNIFVFNSKKIQKILIQEFPQIEKLEIKKKFPKKIIINISQRKPKFLICETKKEKNSQNLNLKQNKNQKCFFADNKGFVFLRPIKTEGFLLPIITTDLNIAIGKQIFDNNIINFLTTIKEKISSVVSAYLDIKEFQILKDNLITQDVVAKTNEGWDIYFDLLGKPKEELDNLKKVLNFKIKDMQKNLEYIDLRFGNKIFYKFK